MSKTSSVEKKAMNDADKAKYLKAAILAGATSAGIGAIVKSIRSKKAREKANDTASAKNAIVVPIKKTKFMEGLPTPEELAQSRGEQTTPTQTAISTTSETPQLAAQPAQTGIAAEMTPEEIEAKKKEILRANARRVDFFGKRANAKKAQDESKKDDEKSEEAPKKENPSDGLSEKKDERTLFRDEEGKFVSPTDPIAVRQQEKSAAIEGIWDSLIHPIDSAGKVWNAATDKPIWFTAGALGSIYLAAKISDAINERRREKAKNRLEDARSEYVNLLEGGEKTAADIRDTAGMVLGSAFFVPMALTALVTNRIIENRKLEKKRQKEMSDSYPDDPIIMYKTSENTEIPISPEALLAVMTVKRAMFLEAERCEQNFDGTVKQAQLFAGPLVTPETVQNAGGWALDKLAPMSTEEGTRVVTDMMAHPDNNAHLLSFTRGFMNGGEDGQKAQDEALKNMAKSLDPMASMRLDRLSKDPKRAAELRSSVLKSKAMQNLMFDRFTNSQYDDTFGNYRNELVNNEIAKTFKKDGLLYKIISWIANNMGIGRYMTGNRINEIFAANRAQKTPAVQAAPAQTTFIPKKNGQGGTIIAR